MAASLNCPNCGAPTSADATRCGYCGSGLAAAPCPSCLGSMWAGSEYCPHCGARATVAADAGGPTLKCPGCDGDMPHVKIGETAMHRCASCDSAWLDPQTFMNLCTNAESRGAVIAALGSVTAETKKVAMGTVRYVRCPVCKNTMNRTNFGHTSGIVIDTCKGHGAWFEHDELHGVLDFVARGGLQANKQNAVVSSDQATVTISMSILGAPQTGANANAMRAMLDVMSNDSASSLLHGFFTSLFG